MNDIDAALADLRKVIEENPDRDRFPRGTVIRWTANERYTYAAIKTNVGWFTTSRPGNPFVKQQMNYEEFQEVLQREEVTDIAVATGWVRLDGTPASEEIPVEPRPMAKVNTRVQGGYAPNPTIEEAFGFTDEPRNAEGF